MIGNLGQKRFVGAFLFVGLAGGCHSIPNDGSAEDGGDTTEDEGTSDTGEGDAPTWHQDVAPLVHERCVGCHYDGGIAPFSMETYEEAAPWGESMANATADRYMPPFLAQDTDQCQPRFGFKEDLRLSDEEIQLIADWVEAGKPEGDPDTAAPLPQPPSLELENPDLTLTIPKPVEIAGSSDQFLCFSLDPQLEEDAWLDALQINAGNDQIVHHVLIYLDEGGVSASKVNEDGYYTCFGDPGIGNPTLLGAWAPGSTPITTPEKAAMQIPAGSRLVMNVHYHPSIEGVETDPDTSIDLRWYQGIPQWLAQLQLVGNGTGLLPGEGDTNDTPEFRIPAGVTDHKETMLYTLPPGTPDLTVWSVGTHMHYVGTDMIFGAVYQDPLEGGIEQDCYVQTPNWDFNWQRGYIYDGELEELPVLGTGDRLFMECTYDNSLNNPFVVEALEEQGLGEPVDVFLGEETLDEMCLAVFGVAVKLFP